ncbi:MAG: hypothetical protein KAJ40_04875, partial [Alphaproteobacteria bacterium]|nr:hypothetical protein [Alphaproteobacteria bacterium]
MKTLNVHINLAERSYDIAIGQAILSSVKDYLPFDVQGKKLFVITDENVHGYGYASALRDSFIKTGASWCELMVFPFGEATKSYDRLKE